MAKRIQQVSDEIQRILGEVIQYELKDPRVGFATVVRVEISADLQHARAMISVMGSDDERRETMDALKRARGFLRRRIAQALKHMRSVPELHLVLDTSLDYSLHIDEVLRRASAERDAQPPREAPETSEPGADAS